MSNPHHCPACQALTAECGEHFDLYARKLLVRGWAGVLSPVERAYVRAHRPVSEKQAAHMCELRRYSFGKQAARGTDGKPTAHQPAGLLNGAQTPLNGAL